MGTTKDDLLAVVNKLVADVQTQTEANAAKTAADGAVVSALQEQASKAAAHAAATGAVQNDLAELQKIANAYGDEDDKT